MAYANEIRSRQASGLAVKFGEMFREIGDAYRRHRVYRETLRELNALTQRELDDLGIHRSMVTRIALEAAYGK